MRTERRNLELLGEVVGDNGSEGGEERCEKHAHISDVDGDVEEVQHVVKGCRGHHQTCTENDFSLKCRNSLGLKNSTNQLIV